MRRYKRKEKEYKTVQYTITLRKEAVESNSFSCDEEVCIIHKKDFKELIDIKKQYKKFSEENRQLKDQLSVLETDYAKLKNECRHLQEVFKKREKQISNLENELERLQNRGLLQIILEKLTKRKAIESPQRK